MAVEGHPPADSAEIETVLERNNGQFIRYRLSFASVHRRLEILDEVVEEAERGPSRDDVDGACLYCHHHRGHPVTSVRTVGAERHERAIERQTLPSDQSVLAQRKDLDQHPEVTEIRQTFSSILMFDEWTVGRHTPTRDPQRADLPEDRLLPDGSNLNMVLNQMRHSGEERVNTLLKQFFPRFERMSIRVCGGSAQLCFFEHGFKAPIPATRLSDGTKRFVALLAALLSPAPPPLLCIENPELGLHPDALPLLAEIFVEASHRTQLLVTTHSDALVSALTDLPAVIVICERPGASTKLRRLDPQRLAGWLYDYRLGDVWRMGELGANP
ncbi:MAG: AAA family ATPase [Bryobacterales bacterium]|nr:AAA family ATPase [Bryobacterales bacterium]